MIDVCMPLVPFARLEAPSLALGIFKSSFNQMGISSSILYSNLDFASNIGSENYHTISTDNVSLLGEWIFSKSLFEDDSPSWELYFEYLRSNTLCRVIPNADLLQMRIEAEVFIENLSHEILRLDPKIVSCTSTFQQHTASLALLKRLKALNPSLITMMGGANCESIMGLTTKRLFGFVDYILSGEGDFQFPLLCHSLLNPNSSIHYKTDQDFGFGVFHSKSMPNDTRNRPVVEHMDEIPIPDYDDYFSQLSVHPIKSFIKPGLPVEASRGCWWGQAVHCTFCGLNGEGIKYRSKTAQRMYDELVYLMRRYGDLPFGFVDNIVPLEYMNTFFSPDNLAASGLPKEKRMFFEVKPNLTKNQLLRMSDAGVIWIQPGIESLHDDALKELKKGTTLLTNLQLLRWAAELGIYVSWSILTQFPREQLIWLSEMDKTIPLLHHLQPPMALSPVQYHRFSPYFNSADEYGLQLAPSPAYSFIYPFEEKDLADLAYNFFDKNCKPLGDSFLDYGSSEANTLYASICSWKSCFYGNLRPLLCYQELDGGLLQIIDTRKCSKKRIYLLSGLEKKLMIMGDCVTSLSKAVRQLRLQEEDVTSSCIANILASLESQGLVLVRKGHFLSLPIGGQVPRLPKLIDYPGGALDFQAIRMNMDLKRPFELDIH